MPVCLELKSELYNIRGSFKRLARQLVLEHYPELSPNLGPVLAWCQKNSALIPADMAQDKRNLIMLFRKAMVADLTGIENVERKAKFVYDLSRLVHHTALLVFDGAVLNLFAIPI